MKISTLKLSFAVSRDEEFVRVAIVEPWLRELGDHAHHYLLLILARRRLADAAAGLPEGDCGWICIDDFRHDPTLAPPRLNTDVFRIRRQLAAHGVTDADAIIERRKPTRELRIGTSRLSIASL